MNDIVRLRHMLEAARAAIHFVEGRERADLDRDTQLTWAIVKAIEIIGEAAYRISPATREQIPSLPWDNIVGMRHRLVHAYFDINLDILWKTVHEALPPLVETLDTFLQQTTPLAPEDLPHPYTRLRSEQDGRG